MDPLFFSFWEAYSQQGREKSTSTVSLILAESPMKIFSYMIKDLNMILGRKAIFFGAVFRENDGHIPVAIWGTINGIFISTSYGLFTIEWFLRNLAANETWIKINVNEYIKYIKS